MRIKKLHGIKQIDKMMNDISTIFIIVNLERKKKHANSLICGAKLARTKFKVITDNKTR
jgi:hypothetical protein